MTTTIDVLYVLTGVPYFGVGAILSEARETGEMVIMTFFFWPLVILWTAVSMMLFRAIDH